MLPEFHVCVSKSNPEACVPAPYWTHLHQWSQQLRTLMIWTHWGLLLCAHRLSARSSINTFLLKLFAGNTNPYCYASDGGVKYVAHIYIYIFRCNFFLCESRKWLFDMHEEKESAAVLWPDWNIHFTIDFHKRCICDYLIFSSLNRVELHIVLSWY